MVNSKRKGLSDYRTLAEERSLNFLGKIAPYSTRDTCKWSCKKCGREIQTSYSNLINATHGCRCQIGAVVQEEQYHKLGEALSLEWRGKKLPINTREDTEWYSKVTKELFVACYADLAYRNPVKRSLRKHVARTT